LFPSVSRIIQGRQQHPRQNRNDRYNDKKLYECKKFTVGFLSQRNLLHCFQTGQHKSSALYLVCQAVIPTIIFFPSDQIRVHFQYLLSLIK